MTFDATYATPGSPRDFALINERDRLVGNQKGKLTLVRLNESKLEIVDTLAVNGCVCTLVP